jgi:hypothetical protein
MHSALRNPQWLSYRHQDILRTGVTALQHDANILPPALSRTRRVPCVSMFRLNPRTNRTRHPVREHWFFGHPAPSLVVISTELWRLTVVSMCSLPQDLTEMSSSRWFQQQPRGFFARTIRLPLCQWDPCLNSHRDYLYRSLLFPPEQSSNGFRLKGPHICIF